MRKFSFTKGRGIFVVDLILIPVFILVVYSGLKLHQAGHLDDHDVWSYWAHFHILVGLLSLVFGGLHIKAHWGWYKSLIKKGPGGKSRVTVILSLLFLVEIVTGVVLVMFIDGGNSAVGMWHYRLGIVMILFLLCHLILRFRIMLKGLGFKSKSKTRPSSV